MAPCNKNGEIFEYFYSWNYTTVKKFSFPVYWQGFFPPKDMPQENCQIHRIIKTTWGLYRILSSLQIPFNWQVEFLSALKNRSKERRERERKRKDNYKRKRFTHKRKVLFELNNILLNYWYHIHPNRMWNLSKYIFTVLTWMLFLCYKFQLV